MKHYFCLCLILLVFASCTKDEKPIQYQLTTKISPTEGGSVSSLSGTFESGEEIQLRATPAEGYVFKNWTGAVNSAENPITVTFDMDKKITAVFEKSDMDNDGIFDDEDQCDETPSGETVDSNGCSPSQKDTDGDGVFDASDQCPDTVAGTEVDENGCEVENGAGGEVIEDMDGDGVEDALDACPETAEGESVDELGCSKSQKDSDNDGVSDDVDQCPETPEGENVDEQGCADSQKDGDGDGVPDSRDSCSDTPEGEEVDDEGCSASQRDTDNDGIADANDECPSTPEGEEVNELGCTVSLTTFVPDDTFEQNLIEAGLDDVLDDVVLTANISEVESLTLGGDFGPVNGMDLTGLEDFTSLEELTIAFVDNFSVKTSSPNTS